MQNDRESSGVGGLALIQRCESSSLSSRAMVAVLYRLCIPRCDRGGEGSAPSGYPTSIPSSTSKRPERILMPNGRYSHNEGYIRIKVGTRIVLEHRHIMELTIGRKLRPKEVVHHKNGNRADNRLSNLAIMTKSVHAREHGLERGTPMIGLECPQCHVMFTRPVYKIRYQQKIYKATYCSKSCVGKSLWRTTSSSSG